MSVTLGKYRLLVELGRGGMATVYLAVTNDSASYFTKLVVIKKLREEFSHDTDFLTMLADEARLAARLNHPNLVQTTEVGEANGSRYLTMEYLDGQPFHRIINRAKGSIPREVYLSIIIDTLAGLDYAHELADFDGTPLNVVHRDVTPHNIFVTYEGQVKVVDFGIAKAAGRLSETRHGVVKGKVAYMAPEQAKGAMVDRRTDIFAVGVMLFEVATGRRMWKGMSEIDIVRALVSGTTTASPRAVDPNVDEELDRICSRALAFKPDERYATAADFQHDLEAYALSKGKRPAARSIGKLVADLFADKRAATQQIISAQLESMRAERPPNGVAQLQGASAESGSASSGSLSMSVSPASASDEGPTQVRNPSDRRPPAPAPAPAADAPRATSVPARGTHKKRDTRFVFAAAAAGLLAIGTAVGTTMLLKADDSAEAATPAAAGSITVTLRATPADTKFSIDKGALLDNPFTGTFPRDGQTHLIRAVAPGYPPQEESVVFSEDQSLRFSLAASRGDRAGTASNPGATPAKSAK